ncbi:PREDICTED: CTP synthase 1-like [Branchiostoma belcheri]|uniref:CTP synthase n=1 Tax=Branchiostoma belcheri TaxID=7741 RepID=A0A6P5AZZ8_BRABE|nr:PREDICTED: CTP synthase 1-like [Branchiostoma belcheri]
MFSRLIARLTRNTRRVKFCTFPERTVPTLASSTMSSNMRYILVSGGVISGIGKGVIASSIGTILKSCGLKVTSIKIDPYLNIDAGTFSPYEHGEVFVLDDGGEVDLDLGNYERFLDVKLTRDNNITTGKIYQSVINKERKGDYLGKTVQVVPHITDAIQEWVQRVAKIPVDGKNEEPEVCVIELGGTIGDIEGMPFVEAFRQFQFRVKRENFCCVHVSLVPQPGSTGEQKTKPTQNSVRELRGLGLSPDLVVARSQNPIGQGVKEKISMFCHVSPDQVICIHDCSSIYRVPVMLEEQNVIRFFSERLHLEMPSRNGGKLLRKWRDLSDRFDHLRKDVSIALVGKYTQLEDAYASVIKALKHASLACNHKLTLKYIEACHLEEESMSTNPVRYHEAWSQLCSSDGVLVPGGFGVRGVEGKIRAAEWARKNKRPYLGVCLGMQVAVIEYARNVLGFKDAHSTEFDPKTENQVVIDMPEHNPGDMGGTMRLGQRKTIFKSDNSVLRKLYGKPDYVEERHRHRYEVNPEYVERLQKKGLHFVGQDVEGERMEIVELEDHPFYVGVQYHPEFLSRPMRPSPPYLGLLLASCGKLQSYISRGCRHSPREPSFYSDTSSEEDDLPSFSSPPRNNSQSSGAE